MATEMTDHSGQVRTGSGINVLLGIWLIASAWVYGPATASVAMMWNYVVVGALILIVGAIRYSSPHMRAGLSWVNIVLGIWTLLSPWIYGYSGTVARVWNDVIVGIVVLALAIWSATATASEHRHAPIAH